MHRWEFLRWHGPISPRFVIYRVLTKYDRSEVNRQRSFPIEKMTLTTVWGTHYAAIDRCVTVKRERYHLEIRRWLLTTYTKGCVQPKIVSSFVIHTSLLIASFGFNGRGMFGRWFRSSPAIIIGAAVYATFPNVFVLYLGMILWFGGCLVISKLAIQAILCRMTVTVLSFSFSSSGAPKRL